MASTTTERTRPHSSQETEGKVIVTTHGSIKTYDRFKCLENLADRSREMGKKFCASLLARLFLNIAK